MTDTAQPSDAMRIAVAVAIDKADTARDVEGYADSIDHARVSDWNLRLADAAIRAMEAARIPEAGEEVCEQLRALMLKQPITGRRETYTDGFAMGLCEAIKRIDTASPTPTELTPSEVERAPRPHVEGQTSTERKRWLIWDNFDHFASITNIADEGDAIALCKMLNELAAMRPSLDEAVIARLERFAEGLSVNRHYMTGQTCFEIQNDIRSLLAALAKLDAQKGQP